MNTFIDPDFGKDVRIEQHEQEVHIVFVAASLEEADEIYDELVGQIKAGGIDISLRGTSVEEIN